MDQSNSTHTSASPIAEEERTRNTPVAPFMALSMGKVILASTSSGARPSASAKIVTTGRLRSGKTSTDRVDKAYSPYTVRKTAKARTRSAWRRLRSMILFSMALVLHGKCIFQRPFWAWQGRPGSLSQRERGHEYMAKKVPYFCTSACGQRGHRRLVP